MCFYHPNIVLGAFDGPMFSHWCHLEHSYFLERKTFPQFPAQIRVSAAIRRPEGVDTGRYR